MRSHWYIFFLTCRGSVFKIIEKNPALNYKIHHNNPNCQRANFPLSSHIFSLFYQFIDICQVQHLTTVCKFIANLFQIASLFQTSRLLFILWDVWSNIYKAIHLLFRIQTHKENVSTHIAVSKVSEWPWEYVIYHACFILPERQIHCTNSAVHTHFDFCLEVQWDAARSVSQYRPLKLQIKKTFSPITHHTAGTKKYLN